MKKFLSLVLALVMTMSLVTVSAGAEDFTDDSSITYEEAVDVTSAVGIIDGYTDGSFQPTTNLTRGAAAKIICNLILGPTTAAALGADTAPYSDVPTTNVFAGYIAYCQKEGIISGYADGTFRPAAPLTGYAFMKMLLGALGYDSAKENYTGANWSVNVAKQALAIGLDDGNDEFVGQASVNREEAMLYAFNTMTATMVEYPNDTTIVVGDVTVSSSGKASEVADAGNNNNTIYNDGKLQFAEKYFSDLKLSANGTDDFDRPANVWKLKAEMIGTYTQKADATYTAKVEVGQIYADLGLGKTVVSGDVDVFEDGDSVASVAISKGDDTNTFGANGVLTQVFYDDDNEEITITMVNTYVGTINRTVEADDYDDRYIEVATESVYPSNAGANEKFETNEEFEDDAYVLYTFDNDGQAVQSVKVAESVEGELEKIVSGKSVTLDGTVYKYSNKYDGDVLTVGSTYTAYLDEYGYVIYLEEQEYVSSDYALVLAVEGTSEGGFKSNRAKLLFTDGNVKTVDTAKDYKGGSYTVAPNDIVTYSVEDGTYTLKKVATTVKETNESLDLKQGTAKIVVDGTNVYANSKTVFVVKNGSDYNVYTGINNAPTINAPDSDGDDTDAASVYYYVKSGIVTVMFITATGADVVVENSKSNVLFVAGESASKLTVTSDADYYEYNAVVNGEITTVMIEKNAAGVADAGNIGNMMFKAYSTDSKGVITSLTPAVDGGDIDVHNAVVGTEKVSGDYTVKLGSASYTVADDAKIYRVDEDGNIEAITVKNIGKDANDESFFIEDAGQITYLFIQEK